MNVLNEKKFGKSIFLNCFTVYAFSCNFSTKIRLQITAERPNKSIKYSKWALNFKPMIKPFQTRKKIIVSKLRYYTATFLNPNSPHNFQIRAPKLKMSDREDSDSDAPEEFTTEQAIKQDEILRQVQKENKIRVVREGKERRRQWAQRKTPRSSKQDKSVQKVEETETEKESLDTAGMLPNDIVQLLAAREKKVFLSDSEDEKVETKVASRKKKLKTFGTDTVILKDISPPPCLQNSLEFLRKTKMQVSRSSSVLDNSNQALRLISTSGLLSKK
ncbi:uncharacterized protein LOC126655598 [Mercurialis annua]|uniref:uncharacterized protein LOC126655598 n=1 Tax=Mercurialis annua TaxID=3986 RepID=UPI002160BA50|nr:uncharacterized protein LOC126655598 [Mercurialis annua]